MGKVIKARFNRKKKYHLACSECNSISWSIHLDPDIGQAIVCLLYTSPSPRDP